MADLAVGVVAAGEGLGVADDPGAVGEDLEAARPLGQEGERLLVLDDETRVAHPPLAVGLGADLRVGILRELEAEGVEELLGDRGREVDEEVVVVADEGADGDVADLLEVVLEPGGPRIGGPRLDVGIVDDEEVVGQEVILEVGKGDRAGILVEVGATEGPAVGGAEDELGADHEARVEARQHFGVVSLHLVAALEEGELEVVQRVGVDRDDGEGPAVGPEDDVALRIALVVAGGIGERAVGVDAGVFGAEAAGEVEAALEELDAGLEVTADDVLGGEARGVHAVEVLARRVDAELSGIGPEVVDELVVVDALDGGKAELAGTGGVDLVEEGRGPAVAAEAVIEITGEVVLVLLGEPLEAQTGLEIDGKEPVEVAVGVDVGGEAVGADVVLAEVGAFDEGAVREGPRIDRRADGAGGVVDHGDRAGPQVGVVGEGDGDVGHVGARGEERALVLVLVEVLAHGVAEAGLPGPLGAVVVPDDRRVDGAVDPVAHEVGAVHLALPGQGDGGGAGLGGDPVDDEVDRVVGGDQVEVGVLKAGRDAVVLAEAEVEGRAEGDALGRLGPVADREVRRVGAVRSGEREVGEVAGAAETTAPEVLVERGRAVVVGVAGGDRVAELVVDRSDPRHLETGADLRAQVAVGAGGALEVELRAAAHEEGAVVEDRFRPLERAARHEVDRTGESVAGMLGERGVVHLDPREVVDRDEVHRDRAGGVELDAGGGDVEALDRDGHEGRGHAVEDDVAGVAAGVLDRDAGHELEEVGRVALGEEAELVGREHVLDVGREALDVGGVGRGVELAARRDLEGVQLDRLGGPAAHAEVDRDAPAGRHHDRLAHLARDGVEDHQSLRPGRRAHDETPLRVGERLAWHAVDAHPHGLQVLAGGLVEDAAVDQAGLAALRLRAQGPGACRGEEEHEDAERESEATWRHGRDAEDGRHEGHGAGGVEVGSQAGRRRTPKRTCPGSPRPRTIGLRGGSHN